MSIPPQLIRVKRKRDDESPVTFLQFDEGAKRHRNDSNWVYQRRHPGPQSPTTEVPSPSYRDAKPVIHVCGPGNDAPEAKKNDTPAVGVAPTSTSDPKAVDPANIPEHRRFHISRKMMMASGAVQTPGTGVNKRPRYGPAVFVERSRAKASQRASKVRESIKESVSLPAGQQIPGITMSAGNTSETKPSDEQPQQERRLKKPAARSRQPSPLPDANSRTPLPTSILNPHNQDMSRMAADMNDWVMKEIGANLQEMEQEKQRTTRFKPKAPAKRYQERHPEAATSNTESNDVDMTTGDTSDMEDDDDWVIEEYVRIPAHAMTVNVAPTDVGVLVLDGKEESNLFFGPDRDEDEELDEDEEDENAENYYTADYPEDEVESDDEYGRHPYGYRNGNASDDEEFDNIYYDESDNDMVLDGDNDDDTTMARIRTYMKRSRAFQ
ncbi:uncharacterized protein FIESC28_05739 [Fusarium coffeatum]|uniref:Transcription factor Iwr1 domain-containing protein n=1 Tax=Fusarium coffeatum TaxID=231269 RepID=A0A366RRD2_9HYPO|nr:uncharacterized protein FIESC28_05739 [Fusarium coffeatum]RBR19068.1 hypothetical protein FIESC28_05739 [Fusarium coffeatum]